MFCKHNKRFISFKGIIPPNKPNKRFQNSHCGQSSRMNQLDKEVGSFQYNQGINHFMPFFIITF